MTRGQWAAVPQEPLPPQHLVMAQNSLVKRWRTQADPQTGAGVAASPLLLTGHSPRWPALLEAKCPPPGTVLALHGEEDSGLHRRR